MGRPVHIVAPPTAEADVLQGILDLNLLNVVRYRNTRGRYKTEFGNWISYGVGPNGASDVIGFRVVRITPDMVGARLAQFLAIEAKKEGEDPNEEQQRFIDGIIAAGGCAGVCRSVQDAATLLLDLESLKRRSAR